MPQVGSESGRTADRRGEQAVPGAARVIARVFPAPATPARRDPHEQTTSLRPDVRPEGLVREAPAWPRRWGTNDSPRPAISPRFAGLVTFGRYPRSWTCPRRTGRWIGRCSACRSTAASRTAPGRGSGRGRSVRNRSTKRYSLAHSVDVCERLSLLCDAGDSPVAPDCEANASRVYEFARGFEDRRGCSPSAATTRSRTRASGRH